MNTFQIFLAAAFIGFIIIGFVSSSNPKEYDNGTSFEHRRKTATLAIVAAFVTAALFLASICGC